MSDPIGSLPQELFNKVIHNSLLRVPSSTKHVNAVDDHNIKALSAMSLVNKLWNGRIKPRLYSFWTYDDTKRDTKPPVARVWMFLRTILQSPSNAALVQTVRFEQHRRDHAAQARQSKHDIFSSEDETSISNALALTGLNELEDTIRSALNGNNCRPLIALLLASLPNLKTMSLAIGEVDVSLKLVLRLALRSDGGHPERRAFGNLEEANLFTPEQWDGGDSIFCTNNVLPMYQLPRIKRLSAFDFWPQQAVHMVDSGRSSPITDLILAPTPNYTVTFAAARQMISLPKSLVRLSLYFDDYRNSGHEYTPITNAELWGLLLSHRQSLKHLDIYRDCEQTGGRPIHHRGNSHMNSLRDFSRLTFLLIQPEVLLGPCCNGEKSPFHLRETLPGGLESLTFYGNEGLAKNKGLEGQLVELVQDARCPNLKYIELEDVRDVLSEFSNLVKAPRRMLEQACAASGVRLCAVQTSMLPRGGYNLCDEATSTGSSEAWHERLKGLRKGFFR